jgi:hypothetical protein
MACLKNILQMIQDKFQVHIHGPILSDKRIESVHYLLPAYDNLQQLDPDTLYIGNYEDFHPLQCKDCILLLGCPLDSENTDGFYINQDLDPFAVLNCIQQELYDCRKADLKRDEVFHVLQAGYGYQSMLDTARSYLKNPITLCTTSFSVLASSPKDYFDDKFDMYNNRFYLKSKFIRNMQEKEVLQHMFTSFSPIIVEIDDSPGISYLFCSIHIRRAAVGYLCISSLYRPFEPADSDFAMNLSKLLSLEMQKAECYAEKTGLKYECFLTDLIEQNLHSENIAARHMAQLGEPFYQYFWVLGFTFHGFSNHQLNPNYYIDQLSGIFKRSMAFFYKGTLILLHTSNYKDPYQSIDKHKLSHFLQLNQINIAISFRFEQILDTWRYYNQVMFLLKNKKCIMKERCLNYEDNYLNHLLEASQNDINAETIIHPDLLFLQNYDQENNTEYMKTLKAYFRNNRNALNTSNYLHIHKSTFFYRIGKIQDLTEFDPSNAEILFSYEFSFRIMDF